MNNWVKEAEHRGVQELLERKKAHEVLAAVKEKFRNEDINEETVKAFLDPFAAHMASVIEDLVQAGYEVIDEGYKYIPVSQHQSEKFALLDRVKGSDRGATHIEAFGRLWTISVGEGPVVDTVYLFPQISDESHFSYAHYTTGSGEGRILGSPDDVEKGVAVLQQMIGSRIAKFFSETRIPGPPQS